MNQCLHCPLYFSTLVGLRIHLGKAHIKEVPKTCFDCQIGLTEDNQQPFDRKRGVHICRDCRNKRSRDSYHEGTEINRSYDQSKIDKPFKCEQCEKTFYTEKGLRIHKSKIHSDSTKTQCCHCNVELTEDNQRKSERDRAVRICKNCIDKKTEIWKAIHPDKWKIYEDKCKKNTTPEKRLKKVVTRQITRVKQSRMLRQQVIEAYGGVCQCCGESIEEFLVIDHREADPENDNPMLKMRRSGTILYRYLIINGFPKDRFQLLCHNCNMARALYGYCPHQPQLDLFSSWAYLKRSSLLRLAGLIDIPVNPPPD